MPGCAFKRDCACNFTVVTVYSMYLGYITLHYPKKGGEEQKEMKLQLHAVKQGYIFEIEVNFPYCTEQIPMQCKTLYHSEPIMKFSTEKTEENLNFDS